MEKSCFSRSFVLIRLIASGVMLLTAAVGSAATIGTVTITPQATPVGVASTVIATAKITDAGVIASSVNLQKIDAQGRVLAVIGDMRDDGTGGDAVANDQTFTIRFSVYEEKPASLTFRASAGFLGSLVRVNSSPLTFNITGAFATGVSISQPANLVFVNTGSITVIGNAGDPGSTVRVNGIQATKNGNGFQTSIPLQEGNNTITAVATNTNGTTSSASIQVTLDTTPPHVSVDSPANGFTTTETALTVTGIVNDIVVGTVNSQQAQVTVNGLNAIVANRTFTAANVPLQLGLNNIQVIGRDQTGNSATASISVTRQAITQPFIKLISGNNQSGVIGSALPAPLVVQLLNGATPVPNTPVVFKITENDGSLQPGTGKPQTLIVNTNLQGQAQALLTLGNRSGAGNNTVEAYAGNFQGTASFVASGNPKPAAKINVDSGNNQFGAVNQSLALPFVAVVTDAGNNRLGGIPVTFVVKQGAGLINGLASFSTVTDGDGRALAILTLGSQPGQDNNVVEASFSGNPGFPAAFTASGKIPGNPNLTSISGVVLDNSNNPIPNVMMRVYQTNQGSNNNQHLQVGTPVPTDAKGLFKILPAPVGFYKLMADGTTATQNGKQYPTLEYDLVTVAGQDNSVGSPIYLPQLDPLATVCVNATTGGVLKVSSSPGFSLTIQPGSATFPGGSKTGCVSVTPVNPDKIPMVPGFGQQPRYVVTIQPVGTIFNPPAAITIPNMDGLAPNAKTEMYSYDHDLAAFVAIGSATVSVDGSIIASDPGVGVLKAGWHCGGDPNVPGSAGTCPECAKCQGSTCVPDASQKDCRSGDGCCLSGSCLVLPVIAAPVAAATVTYVENIIAPASSNWGETKERELTIDIGVYFDKATMSWKTTVTKAEQRYTIWYRLVPGVSPASVSAASTNPIYCKMRSDLAGLGNVPSPQWYLVGAVEAHERQHVVELKSVLDPRYQPLKAAIEGLSTPYSCGQSAADAQAKIKALPAYNKAITDTYNSMVTAYYAIPDPNANTDSAERSVVNPLITLLDAKALMNGWTCP